jgi:hypothetical protein
MASCLIVQRCLLDLVRLDVVYAYSFKELVVDGRSRASDIELQGLEGLYTCLTAFTGTLSGTE